MIILKMREAKMNISLGRKVSDIQLPIKIMPYPNVPYMAHGEKYIVRRDPLGSRAVTKLGYKANKSVVFVLNKFQKNQNMKTLPHGRTVSYYAKAVAPHAEYIDWEINFSNLSMDSLNTHVKSVNSETHYRKKIVNCSFGPAPFSYIESNKAYFDTYIRMVRRYTKLGAILVFSAGNENHLSGTCPLSRRLFEAFRAINEDEFITGGVVLVGASEIHNDSILSQYSNMAGLTKDFYIYAPVDYIQVKIENDTNDKKSLGGTSFAAPQIAALLAKLETVFPTYSGKQLIKLLLASAKYPNKIPQGIFHKIRRATNLSEKKIELLKPEDIFGRGVVNVYDAVLLGLERDINDIKLPELDHSNDIMIRNAYADPFDLYELYQFLDIRSVLDITLIIKFLKVFMSHAESFLENFKTEAGYLKPGALTLMWRMDTIIKYVRGNHIKSITPVERQFLAFYAKYIIGGALIIE